MREKGKRRKGKCEMELNDGLIYVEVNVNFDRDEMDYIMMMNDHFDPYRL